MFSGVRANKHGGSESDHIKALKAMGAPIEESGIEMPEQLRYLYDLFMEIRFNRVPSDDGFKLMASEGLTYSDIHYNSLLTGLELHKWEIKTLLSMSSIFDKYST
jgi:hypothetical protein